MNCCFIVCGEKKKAYLWEKHTNKFCSTNLPDAVQLRKPNRKASK